MKSDECKQKRAISSHAAQAVFRWRQVCAIGFVISAPHIKNFPQTQINVEYDIADILTRIEEGETFREIAAVYGVNVSSISRLLDKEENAQQSARARSISAESWLDRGFHELVDAKTSEEITRARYIAQECARRAALRNPAYREKQDHNHSGSLTLNVASELAALNGRSPD